MNPTQNSTPDAFHRILADAQNDPNIIGFWLGGSRGKGLVTKTSDYDPVMLVKDNVLSEYKERYENQSDRNIELSVQTLDSLKGYALWNSHTAWDRYDFAHLQPLVDKTGQLQEIFDEKARIPESERHGYVRGHLDGYINEVFRSLKCLRDEQVSGWRIHAAQSVTLLCNVLFGMHGRVPPFAKYLEWELKTFPLPKLPMPPDELIESVLKVIETGSVPTQQNILAHVEAMARADGYGSVFDGWGQKLNWIRKFSPSSPAASGAQKTTHLGC
ncbi:MAG: hypothetical protein ABSD58_11330 [Verrucomicrobiia bacterium]|jgi:hypothetical protein